MRASVSLVEVGCHYLGRRLNRDRILHRQRTPPLSRQADSPQLAGPVPESILAAGLLILPE